jgi:hypothetical protein
LEKIDYKAALIGAAMQYQTACVMWQLDIKKLRSYAEEGLSLVSTLI